MFQMHDFFRLDRPDRSSVKKYFVNSYYIYIFRIHYIEVIFDLNELIKLTYK